MWITLWIKWKTFKVVIVYITLKNAKFSDGSTLTANDVLYSFNLAKKCDVYSSSLSQQS